MCKAGWVQLMVHQLTLLYSGGLKRLVEKELPWLFWMWCLGHQLELAMMYATTIAKCTAAPGTEQYLYQIQELKTYAVAKLYYTNQAAALCERVSVCAIITGLIL